MSSDSEECRILQALRDTPQLFALLDAETGRELGIQKRLRSEFDADLVRAAMTLRDLQKRGQVRFTDSERMWFDPQGLEQATAQTVAEHKAQRFSGASRVSDWCCGIGSDTIALARAGCQVEAVDRLAAHCLRTMWNADVCGVSDQVTTRQADVTTLDNRTGLLHIDPDRRDSLGRRMIRVEDCSPGLAFLQRIVRQFDGGAIKLSPASNFGGKFLDTEIELVSLDGECREATVWFGELAGEDSFRATALPSGETIAADPLSAWTNVGEPGDYLFDPDPALVRAGLVDVLAEQLQLRRLDDAEEYLTGDSPVESPFLQTFQILDNLANNPKQYRRSVRAHSFGQVEVKCRHIPIHAEAVRRRLPLGGNQPGVLIFARQTGRARAFVCQRVSSRNANPREL
jgi:hypothetical protein